MSPQDRKHGREAARRRAAQAAAREHARRRQRRLRVTVAGIVAAVVLVAVVFANVSGDDTDNASTTDSSTTTSTSVDASTPVNREGVITDDPAENLSPAFEYGTGACPPETKPDAPKRTFDAAPMRCLREGVDYKAVVDTDQGSFTIDLLEDRSPGTVNNFVVLARWGYFDGLTFHRVVPGFVNQAGDPKGDGSGGPGYEIADELPTSVASYLKWAVAMANSGPSTNGSQWFTCIDCSTLPTPGYSLFGQVVDGTEIVQKINDLGTGDGPPSTPVVISNVTIQEG